MTSKIEIKIKSFCDVGSEDLNYYDYVIQPVFSTKQGVIKDAVHIPELGPSRELFTKTMYRWKKMKYTDQEKAILLSSNGKTHGHWFNLYTSDYLQELQETPAKIKMEWLIDLLMKGKKVLAVCYCLNLDYCHLSLLKKEIDAQIRKKEDYIMNKETENKKLWYPRSGNKDRKATIARLKTDSKLPPIKDAVLDILVQKGIDTVSKINHFINFSENDIPDVYLLRDVRPFLKRVTEAIDKNEVIVIYGDYDVDGVTASVILKRGILAINPNANISIHINNRFNEGFGLNVLGMESLMKKFPDVQLIITCDNGSVAFDGVELANKKGVDVIISDHHECDASGKLPSALAVVNAKRLDDTYPFKDLCGAGLAFKLMKELSKIHPNGNPKVVEQLMSFAAIATVADMVPLREENRFYVKQGIRYISEENLKCFAGLRKATKTEDITESTFGFMYGPMVNAIGRMTGEVTEAVDLFLCDDEKKSEMIALHLSEINNERKATQKTQESLAEALITINAKQDKKVILIFDDFHEGIAGIVAGKLKEKYQRPIIVLCKSHTDPNVYKGSARSVDGFNVKEALDNCSDLLVKYGGHEMAAGLSVHIDNIASLEDRLCKLMDDPSFYNVEVDDRIIVDCVFSPEDLDFKLLAQIKEYLRPFGTGFEEPVLCIKNFKVDSFKYFGQNEKHLKLFAKFIHPVTKTAKSLEVLYWNGAAYYQDINEPTNIKCIGTPEYVNFRGTASISFRVKKAGDLIEM